MTTKEKQAYTATHLIDALQAFQEAKKEAGNTSYQIDKIAAGLLGLTMALQNIEDRLVDAEAHLDISDTDD